MIARRPPDIAFFGGGSIPAPAPPPEMPSFDFPAIEFPEMEFPAPFDAEGAEAKRKRAEELKNIKLIESKRKGFSSTLLTGGKGLEDDAPTKRPSLIGS